ADQSAAAAGRPRATADNLILSYGEANFPLPVGTSLKEDAQIMTTPSLTLRPGDQLASTSCTTRVVVVRVPADRTPALECGGSPMVAATAGAKPAPPAPGAATLIGKRYVDASETVEVLCTSSGAGALSCDGVAMTLKSAKPLPASD